MAGAASSTPRRLAILDRIVDRVSPLPTEDRLPPVVYNPRLVAYVVGVVTVSLVIALNAPRAVTDPGALAVVATASAALGFYSIPALSGIAIVWSVVILLHLIVAFTLGPVGILLMAIAESSGVAIRKRPGWFRTIFNVGDTYLSVMAAYGVFRSLEGPRPVAGYGLALGGIVAGIAHPIINYVQLGIVLRLAGVPVTLRDIAKEVGEHIPYSVGYGLPAAATVLLYRDEGVLGIVSILATAAVLQGFLVFFARRLHAHNEETAAHQKEREALLQRAIHASDAERQRIAGELHDGVVQDLVGASLTMSAAARARADMSPREQELAGMLRASADTIRAASGDLRTLIVELAPPALRDEGLAVALTELAGKVERAGMALRVTVLPELDLTEVQSKLIYRVCLEAVRNAIKYARGSLVNITVTRTGNEVVTTISDDGVGFTDERRAERRTQGHVGLGLLTGTAKDGGGALSIESQPGHGTVVVLNMPAVGD